MRQWQPWRSNGSYDTGSGHGAPGRFFETRCAGVFEIDTDPTLEEIQYLEDRLYEYNIAKTGFADGENLAIFVRDEAGQRGHQQVHLRKALT
jgi:hypothetical protein